MPNPPRTTRVALLFVCQAKPNRGWKFLSCVLKKALIVRIDRLLRIPDIEQIRNLVVRFLRIRRHLPAQSHIQREPRTHLEVILHV